MQGFELHLGDCLETLRGMAENSVDSIVTDPPYGLAFMGKRWDYDVPSTDIWAECLRVLKPGGHLLAFAGTRTQHRMAVRIEDAGFEIRDMIAWVYGSGFPKSLDVSKAIDKSDMCHSCGHPWEAHGLQGCACVIRKHPDRKAFRGSVDYCMCQVLPSDPSPWQGWGTALKPALEPITVARKPLTGTVVANVLAHGAGALNIDGCRVAGVVEAPGTTPKSSVAGARGSMAGSMDRVEYDGTKGRWPANLIHDGSEDVVTLFPDAPGQQGASSDSQRTRANCYGALSYGGKQYTPRADSGSAARFFYCAKTSRKDRGEENNHPTVKPTDLMAYLCRLVTPPGGIVLDPFMGSGSTGKAAMREGFQFIGCELDPQYLEIARSRIQGEIKVDLFSFKEEVNHAGL